MAEAELNGRVAAAAVVGMSTIVGPLAVDDDQMIVARDEDSAVAETLSVEVLDKVGAGRAGSTRHVPDLSVAWTCRAKGLSRL